MREGYILPIRLETWRSVVNSPYMGTEITSNIASSAGIRLISGEGKLVVNISKLDRRSFGEYHSLHGSAALL